MNRWSFLRTTAQVLIAGLHGIHSLTQSEEVNRPNIILIMTDDQGYGDIGAHGNSMIRQRHKLVSYHLHLLGL